MEQPEVIKKLRGWADHKERYIGQRGRAAVSAYLKLDHDPVEHHRHHPNGCLYCVRPSTTDHLEMKRCTSAQGDGGSESLRQKS